MYKVIAFKKNIKLHETDYEELYTSRTVADYLINGKLADRVDIYVLAETHIRED